MVCELVLRSWWAAVWYSITQIFYHCWTQLQDRANNHPQTEQHFHISFMLTTKGVTELMREASCSWSSTKTPLKAKGAFVWHQLLRHHRRSLHYFRGYMEGHRLGLPHVLQNVGTALRPSPETQIYNELSVALQKAVWDPENLHLNVGVLRLPELFSQTHLGLIYTQVDTFHLFCQCMQVVLK